MKLPPSLPTRCSRRTCWGRLLPGGSKTWSRVFAPRYLQPDGPPALYLKPLAETRPANDWFRDLCLIYTAHADRLVRDSVTLLFRRTGQGAAGPKPGLGHCLPQRGGRRGPDGPPLVRGNQKKIARGLLKMLAVRFSRRPSPHPRNLCSFRPILWRLPIWPLTCISGYHRCRRDRPSGFGDLAVDESAVRGTGRLQPYGLWVFQSAGSVVRIPWNDLR